jgi:hypothetical protein
MTPRNKIERLKHISEAEVKKGQYYPNVRPFTASPAPSTSFSSPSLLRMIGLKIGLASAILERIVGLDDMALTLGKRG